MAKIKCLFKCTRPFILRAASAHWEIKKAIPKNKNKTEELLKGNVIFYWIPKRSTEVWLNHFLKGKTFSKSSLDTYFSS